MAELALFVIFGLAALTGALVMVTARNTVHSAMGLLLTLFSVAVFYVVNSGHFIAAVQVIVYAGAVMTLFLFVIMLIGVDRDENRAESIPLQRPAVALLGLGLLALVLLAGRAAWVTGPATIPVGGTEPVNGTIQAIADELFNGWMLAFEATAVLLTIAAVGTISLAQFRARVRTPAVADAVAGSEVAGDSEAGA